MTDQKIFILYNEKDIKKDKTQKNLQSQLKQQTQVFHLSPYAFLCQISLESIFFFPNSPCVLQNLEKTQPFFKKVYFKVI